MIKRGVFVYFLFNPHHFDKEFAIIFELYTLARSLVNINSTWIAHVFYYFLCYSCLF